MNFRKTTMSFKIDTLTQNALWQILSLMMVISACDRDTDSEPKVGSSTISIELLFQESESSDITPLIEIQEYSISIINEETSEDFGFQNATNLPDSVELPVGTYTISITNSQENLVDFEAPQYAGNLEGVMIQGEDHQSIDLIVTLQNVKIYLEASETFSENINEYLVNVSASNGTLIFESGEERSGYFPAGETLTVTFEIEGDSASQVIASTEAGDIIAIQLDYQKGPGATGISNSFDVISGLISVTYNQMDVESLTIWNGPDISFTKANDTDPSLAANQDRLTDLVWITRGNDGGEIYNAVSESSSTKGVSPAGTEWARGTSADIVDLNFNSFRNTIRPQDVVGVDLVLHLIEDDIYLDVRFDSWSMQKNGGFSYTRSSE